MPNDLGALDVTKPDGAAEAVSSLDDYERETKAALVGWAGIEHDLKGRHKISSGNTAARPLTTGTTPAVDGTLYINTELGQLEKYVLSITSWVPVGHMAEDVNYLFNGSFELGHVTTGVAPGWELAGAAATAVMNVAIVKEGTASQSVTRVGNNVTFAQNVAVVWHGATWWRSKRAVIGAWVYNTTATGTCVIRINDGIGTSNSSAHTGAAAWEWLSVSKVIDVAATSVTFELRITGANGTFLIDGARLSLGYIINDFIPGIYSKRDYILPLSQATIAASNTGYLFPGGGSLTIATPMAIPGVLKGFYANCSAAPGVGTATLTAKKLSGGVTTTTAFSTTLGGTTANDTTQADQIKFAAGDILFIEVVCSAGASTVVYSGSFLIELMPTGI